MLSLGLGDFWGKSQGKGSAASGSPCSSLWVWFFSCRVPVARSLTSSRLHDAPSRLQPPELSPGTARLGKSFCAIMGRPKSRNSQSHQTQLVGFREDPRRISSVSGGIAFRCISALFRLCKRVRSGSDCDTVTPSQVQVCPSVCLVCRVSD